ncbi:MAG TPA: efflux RND transporter periplasmic adaptor subunit, partial [Gammaproteobacteria bacterium]|nr:efflux RND transporter periplasmic adaptor subunit [Gammaproteobacteria bacterium]
GEPAAPQVQAEPIVVQRVRFEPAHTRLEAVGTSRALHSATIYPAAAGEVVAVHFKPGQYVSEGQVLVELDARKERVAVDLAKVQLEDAKRLYERYSRAEGTGAVVPTTLDAAHAAMETAELELRRADIALADRSVEAPFAGYVGITDVDAGDRIGPETAIASLDARRVLLVSFAAPEALIGQLKPGQPIRISPWNQSEMTAAGKISAIDSRIDPANRSFVVRARVDNSRDQLRPGMSFRVMLDIAGRTWPVVPEVALRWGNDGAYVWTLAQGRAERIPAAVIQRNDGEVLVDAALEPGARIVVEGVQRMHEGMTTAELAISLSDTGASAPSPADASS